MMSTETRAPVIVAQYRRERTRYGGAIPLTAKTALALARYHAKTAQDYGWSEANDRSTSSGAALTAERDGFSLRATWTYDEDAQQDSDWRGTFDSDRDGDRYAVPVYFERGGVGLASGQNASTWYHAPDADGYYEYVRKAGASRDVAEAETRRWARERATEETTEYVITVTASKAGITGSVDVILGRASIGGFGMDPDDYDDARQIAAAIEDYGLADEAISEARQTLAALREEDE